MYLNRRVRRGETYPRLANACLQKGTLNDLKHTGKPNFSTSKENIELVRGDVQSELKISTRRRAAQL